MPDHDLRTTIDALCARLQADLQTQAAQMADRFAEEREAAKRETEAKNAEWVAKIDAVREEWNGRLQGSLADAAAEADRRVSAEAERDRLESENLKKAAAEAAERHHQELAAVREEWQARLRAGLADASADADRRVREEGDRIRREIEQAAAESTERVREDVRKDMEQAASASTEQLRAELEQAAAHSTTRLREELEQAAAHANARLREEMNHAMTAERERAGAEIEAERLKTQALSAAVEESQAALAREREAARHATSLLATEIGGRASEAQAVIEGRVAERQAHLAVVERLLSAIRTIDGARSLSDTLTNLTEMTATIAPRAALFVVNGEELCGWKAAGFGDASVTSLRVSADDRAARQLLDAAVTSGRTVSTATQPAPSFANLPQDRAGLAVPITVGGYSVAVLYADDASAPEPEAPAAWPEAVQVLAAHASACLERITAVRTTQAIQQMSASAARPAAAGSVATSPAGEEDSSARRYARLLVSEIKLYNEAAVRTGREQRDLLNRLAPEIERARRLYEERVSPSVGARAVYFHQELVHTLADGDSGLLGGAL